MGLHTGEAELDPGGDEYAVSHTKNRAARIMSAAHGGQILLSQETGDLVDHQLPPGVSLKDLGEHRLKGMQRLEHLYQVCAPGLPQEFPAAGDRHHPPQQPARPADQLHRPGEGDRRQSCRLLENHRLVTLTGSGGTGKTRLSLQVAGELLEDYPRRRLAGGAGPAGRPGSWSRRRSPPPWACRNSPARPSSHTLVDYLRAQAPAADPGQLRAPAGSLRRPGGRSCCTPAPSLTILATSREVLGVAGEAPYRVPPWHCPTSAACRPWSSWPRFDAVRLFVERARVVSPDFAITESNAAARRPDRQPPGRHPPGDRAGRGAPARC